jgi:hypothetical protein
MGFTLWNSFFVASPVILILSHIFGASQIMFNILGGVIVVYGILWFTEIFLDHNNPTGGVS